jgi:hypothetical protein
LSRLHDKIFSVVIVKQFIRLCLDEIDNMLETFEIKVHICSYTSNNCK